MSEIPLDFLFIIGLVIASFIGKLSQKKSKKQISQPDKGESKEANQQGLDDILKDVWQKFNNPPDPQSEVIKEPVSVPAVVSKAQRATELPPKKTVKPPTKRPEQTQTDIQISLFKSVTDDLSNSRKSIRKAFVIKEILDKPKSLKSF